MRSYRSFKGETCYAVDGADDYAWLITPEWRQAGDGWRVWRADSIAGGRWFPRLDEAERYAKNRAGVDESD